MIEKAKILVVDDDVSMQIYLKEHFKQLQHDLVFCENGEEAHKIFNADFDLVVIDFMLPNMNGIELLEKLGAQYDRSKFIIITANPSMKLGIEAIKKGAFDFIAKPFDIKKLLQVIHNALELKKLEEENQTLRAVSLPPNNFSELIGESKVIKDIKKFIVKAASTKASILIEGESGSGKEVVARLIHKNSALNQNPFVSINCGAIPQNLIESTFFGFEKGAFTGAVRQSIGKFESANNGTIFLDEVGELTLEAQVTLLRVLQEKEITRIGGIQPVSLNFRLIAATNRNLLNEVLLKRFREDLYYRTAIIRLEIPPLRERKKDVLVLAQYFLEKYSKIEGKTIVGIGQNAQDLLLSIDWPGNIRQLENAIYRAVAFHGSSSVLETADLSFLEEEAALIEGFKNISIETRTDPVRKMNSFSLKDTEKQTIREALRHFKGNILKASQALEISRHTLYRKMNEYRLDKLGTSAESA